MIWTKLVKSLQKLRGFEQSTILVFGISNVKSSLLHCPSGQKHTSYINNSKFSDFLLKISEKKKNTISIHQFNGLTFSCYHYEYKTSYPHLILIGREDTDRNPLPDDFTHPGIEMIAYYMDAQLSESFYQAKYNSETLTDNDSSNDSSLFDNSSINIYKTAFDQAHSAMAISDMKGNIYDLNEKWIKMHGYDHKSELINENLKIFHTKKQFENEVIPVFHNLTNKGITIDEIGHVDKHGNIIPTLMTSKILVDCNNKTLGFIGIASDLRPRKEYESQVTKIIESVSFGIIIIDIKTLEIVELNQSAINFIGDEKRNIIGQKRNKYGCDLCKEDFKKLRKGIEVIMTERVLINKNNKKTPILRSIQKIDYYGQEVFLESFSSIEELKIAQLAAEESSKLKSSFLSNISHEIRTPLNHILGFTNIIIDDANIQEPYIDYLKIIKKSGNNLLRIIQDIVSVSKIEAGYRTLYEDHIDLKMLLYTIFTKFQSNLVKQNKDIELLLDINITDDQKFVVADEIKIKQITDHLISNAIKYTEQGYVSIHAIIKDNEIIISIKDTGIGIAKKQKDHIFDHFSKIDQANKNTHDGVGLGLSLCKSLSQIMDGDVTYKSIVNKGSVFYFTFPYIPSKRTDRQLDKDISIPELNNKTILVVEDERINYIYIRTIIEKTNANIVWKKNGLEAYNYILDGHKADLILMDMQMPFMDGYEATEKIRQVNSNIPIIAQTANALADDRERCLELGCNEYTTKPLQSDIILWYLKYYLESSKKH